MSKQANGPQLTPIEKVRQACLARGVHGIKGIGRMFRIYDDNGDKRLSREEFGKGLRDYGITDLTTEEFNDLFKMFDQDDNGKINCDEFLINLRPPMSKSRRLLIDKAFDKLDKDGSNVVTVSDLVGVYDHTKHPKFISGEWNRTRVFGEFLKTFEGNNRRYEDYKDLEVTREEFLNYYSGVSASIDKDTYFDLMMRQSWKL